MTRVPVGSYDVAVAPATGADSIEVVEVEPEVVTVASNDSVTVLVAFDKADAQATRGTSRALAVDELPSAQRFPTALVAKVDWADARQRPTTLSAAWLPYSGAGHPAEPPPAAHGSPGA